MFPEPSGETEQQINGIIAAYLEAERAGQAPDQEELLRLHPEFASELRSFFADRDQFQELAEPLAPIHLGSRTEAEVPTLPPRSSEDAPALARGSDSTAPPGSAPVSEPAAPVEELPAPLGTVRYFGDYELLEEIGRGGMGVVYKARQVSLKRLVALKMILAGQLANEGDVRRFYAEAEAAARLDHPGIVPVYEVGRHEEQHYFSMAFVEGESLAEHLAQGLPPLRRVAEVVKQVAEAVAYAHAQGVIHRDLKPANILVDRQGQPRLTDFGLAKRVEAESGLTATGQVMGTPSYMPPEQAGGQRGVVGPLSDVYSLGAVLYCLLTGRPPFQAANPLDTLLQVLDQEPVAPRQLNAAVPRDLETICLKCLEKEPRKRYGSASDLAADLGRYLDGQPIQARPSTRRERIWKWVKRRPATAALVGVSAVAGLGLLALGIALVVSAQELADEAAGREAAEHNRANEAGRREAAERQRADLLTAQAEAARSNAYSSDIALAALALEKNESGGLQGYLDGVGKDLRGFEWYYLWRQNHRERHTLPGGFSPTPSTGIEDIRVTNRRRLLAFSPDGKLLATPHRIWDVGAGQTLTELETSLQNFEPVQSLFFSPDGKAVTLALDSGPLGIFRRPIRFWNVPSKKEQAAVRIDQFMPLGFFDNGKAFLVWHHRRQDFGKVWLTAYEVATGKATVHEAKVVKDLKPVVAFSGESGLLALASAPDAEPQPEVVVWDVHNHREPTVLRFRMALAEFVGYRSTLPDLSFSPDGKTLAVLLGDSTIWLCDSAKGRERVQLRGHSGSIRYFTFSRDGKTLLSVSRKRGGLDEWKRELPGESEVKLWAVPSGKELVSLRERDSPFLHVRLEAAVAPDGKTVATAVPMTRGPTVSGGVVKLWDTATGRLRATLLGHSYQVQQLEFSPDGKTLASMDAGGTVRLWETVEENPRMPLPLDTAVITCMAASPDGRTVAAGHADGTIRLCDGGFLKEMRRLPGRGQAIDSLIFSPDGKRLASSDGKRIATGDSDQIWKNNLRVSDVPTGKPTAVLSDQYCYKIGGFDGKLLATLTERNSYTEAKVWDTALTKERLHIGGVRSSLFAMARAGPILATAHLGKPDAFNVKVWAASTGEERLTLQPLEMFDESRTPPLSLSGDGKFLAITGRYRETPPQPGKAIRIKSGVRLFDTAKGKERAFLPLQFGNPVNIDWPAAVFSPDGKLLVTVSDDSNSPTNWASRDQIALWDVPTGKRLGALANPDKLSCKYLAFSPDGKTLATLMLADAVRDKQGTVLRGPRLGDGLSHWGNDEKRGFGPIYEMHLWDVASRERRKRFIVSRFDPVEAFAFGPEGRSLLILARYRLQAWDAATGQERANLGGAETRFHAIGFAADGRLLAVTDQRLHAWTLEPSFVARYQVRFWDVMRRQELGRPQVVSARDLPLDFDARSLAVSPNLRSPRPVQQMDRFNFGSLPVTVTGLAGVKAVVGSRGVQLIEGGSDQVLHVLKGHEDAVCCVSFSPDGKTLAAGDRSGAIRLWNVASGRHLLTLNAHAGPVNGLAFRADGRALASCSDSEIRVWQTATDAEVAAKQPRP
jgi:WD40 repeat protein/tRNA A-37 threonylcarbamoyl transferase component Bud32